MNLQLRALDNRVLVVVSLSLILVLSPPAGAQELETACADAVSTAEMTACAGDVLRRAEADMLTAYAALADTLEPERLSQLEATQTAWENYAEASANYAASEVDGGSMAPLLALVYRIEQTNARLLWLMKENE